MPKESYYQRHREARKAYQKEYYQLVKEQMRRNREVDKEVRPEVVEAKAAYQSAYYRKNRNRLLARKREAYIRRKAERKES
jgi:hypothetical protein